MEFRLIDDFFSIQKCRQIMNFRINAATFNATKSGRVKGLSIQFWLHDIVMYVSKG